LGHKTVDDLQSLMIEAKATLTAMREVLKDTKAAAREINATLDRSDAVIAGQVSDTLHKRMAAFEQELTRKSDTMERELNETGLRLAHALEAAQEHAIQRIEDNYLEMWRYIAKNAFGLGTDTKAAAELIKVVQVAVEALRLHGGRTLPTEDEVDAMLMRVVASVPCEDPTCTKHATPHAWLQDERTDVV